MPIVPLGHSGPKTVLGPTTAGELLYMFGIYYTTFFRSLHGSSPPVIALDRRWEKGPQNTKCGQKSLAALHTILG